MIELKKTISVWQGTAMLINIVLGAGLLVLPGLAVEKTGGMAFATWVICAFATLPLLSVFVILGRRYPDAGGIAHFASKAFGRYAYVAASLIFLGAVALGLPAIALTGGYYASSTFAGDPHLYAVAILILAFALDICSVSFAGKLNQVLSWVLVVFIIGIAIGSLVAIQDGSTVHLEAFPTSLTDYRLIAIGFPLVFFAFTGWEVGASLTAEFKNPKKDFPIAMLLSYLIAVSLYFTMAYIAQRVDLRGNYRAPFSYILGQRYGLAGSSFVSVTAVILIYANLSTALWGVSRMIYSLSNERVMPIVFRNLVRGQPVAALGFLTTMLCIVVGLDWLKWLDVSMSLRLAGQNFFILYGLAALALLKLSSRIVEKTISIIAILVVSIISVLQGGGLAYPLAITGFAMLIVVWQRRSFHFTKLRS
jgi:amino acid efflux transporter